LPPVTAGGCPGSFELAVVELLFTARENAPATTAATIRIRMILKMVFIRVPLFFIDILKE
jgi:hypothetical protein